MSTLVRRLVGCAVALSLLGGLSLPLGTTSEPFDADGAHGPVFVPEHITQHFEAPVSNPSEHCVFCHWWQAMSSARPVVAVRFAPPVIGAGSVVLFSDGVAPCETGGHASPRGPPSHA